MGLIFNGNGDVIKAVDGSLTVEGLDLGGSTNINAGIATFSGNVNVGGVLTYEDVKNVDSVGIITARAGIDLTGGNITLDDSSGVTADRIVLGNGSDFHIYHPGTDSMIDNNTGNLILRCNVNADVGGNIKLQPKAGEEGIVATHDGAVELYYNNVKTFETTGGGAIVRGTEGGDANLFFYADEGDDNADQWRVQAHSDGSFNILNYADGANETSIKINGGTGGPQLYYNNSKKFETISTGIKVLGSEGGNAEIEIFGDEGDDNNDKWKLMTNANANFYLQNYGAGSWQNSILARPTGATELYNTGNLKLATTSSGVTVTGTLTATTLTGALSTTDACQTGDLTILNGNPDLRLKDSNHAGNNTEHMIAFQDSSGNNQMNIGSPFGEQHLRIKHGTTDLVKIQTDGKVGINEASPDAPLHITGGLPHIRLENSGTSASAGDVFGQIDFKHNDSDDAGVTAAIKCVAEDNAGNSYLTFNNGDGGNADERLRIDSAGKTTSYGEIALSAGGAERVNIAHVSGGDVLIKNPTAASLAFGTNNSERVRIGSGGDLCINTTYSTYGTLNIKPLSTSGSYAAINIENASSGASTLNAIYRSVDLNSSNWADALLHAKSHIFQTSGTERFRIEAAGCKLISSATQSALRINTSLNLYGCVIVRDGGNSNVGAIEVENNNQGSGQVNLVLRSVDLGSTAWAGAKYNAEYHEFSHQTTGKVRIDNDGIKFNTDTASANALSDYEEGSWTPANQYLTITNNNTATYTKVGRLVTVQFDCTYASSPADTAQVGGRIEGLPFAAHANGFHFTPTWLTSGSVSDNESKNFLSFVEGGSNNRIIFYSVGNNCEAIRAQTAGQRVRGTVTYMTS